MIKYIKEIIEEIKRFTGEPAKSIRRIFLLILVILLYYTIGILILKYPNSKVVMFMWEERKLQVFIAYILIGMASYAVAFFSLPYFKNSKNNVAVFFKIVCLIIMLPFHLAGKLVSYILITSRQKNMAMYFAEYMIPVVISLISVSLFCRILMGLQSICGIVFEDRFLAFLLVVICISVFSFSGEKIVYFSFKVEYKKKLSNEDFIEKWKEIKKELQYTKIYFYIISNIILLCAPLEEGGFGELYVNAFFGITTLAALMREVRGNIERDECTEKTNMNLRENI